MVVLLKPYFSPGVSQNDQGAAHSVEQALACGSVQFMFAIWRRALAPVVRGAQVFFGFGRAGPGLDFGPTFGQFWADLGGLWADSCQLLADFGLTLG